MARPSGGYHLADGTPVPGVTTIVKYAQETGGLMGWNFKRGLEVGAQIAAGEIDKRDAWKVRFQTRDDAALVGTAAHDMIEAFFREHDTEEALQRALDGAERASEIAPRARKAFESFESWMALTKLTPVSMEEPMVSSEHRYGGTPDLIARHPDGHLVICDWKSSKALHFEVPIQLAAYRELWSSNGGEPIYDGHALRVSKQGSTFDHRWYRADVLDRAADVFYACLTLHKARRQLEQETG